MQQKQYGQKLKHNLIPGIGISTENAIGYFYDCIEDVLLSTAPMKLFYPVPDGQRLSIDAIVFLWLILNYRMLCSGITDDMKKYKANFFKNVDDFLEVYRNEVTRPVHLDRSKGHKQMFEWATGILNCAPSIKNTGLKYLEAKSLSEIK